jgi:hypothetical protein
MEERTRKETRHLIVASVRGFFKRVWGKIKDKIRQKAAVSEQAKEQKRLAAEEEEKAAASQRQLQAAQLSMMNSMMTRRRLGEMQTHLKVSNLIDNSQVATEFLQQHLAGVPDVTTASSQSEPSSATAESPPCCASEGEEGSDSDQNSDNNTMSASLKE